MPARTRSRAGRLDDRPPEAVPLGDHGDGERSVGAGPALHQILDGVAARVGLERGGDPGRHRHAETVPQAGHVLHHGDHLPAGDPQPDRASGADQVTQGGVEVELGHPIDQLGRGERPGGAQQVEQLLRGGGAPLLAQSLQIGLGGGDHLRIEQLAQPVLAEQLGQQTGVQRQGGGLLLRQRDVALVDERPDVAEQQ